MLRAIRFLCCAHCSCAANHAESMCTTRSGSRTSGANKSCLLIHGCFLPIDLDFTSGFRWIPICFSFGWRFRDHFRSNCCLLILYFESKRLKWSESNSFLARIICADRLSKQHSNRSLNGLPTLPFYCSFVGSMNFPSNVLCLVSAVTLFSCCCFLSNCFSPVCFGYVAMCADCQTSTPSLLPLTRRHR